MHVTGDLGNNVETGALVAFRDKLSGWNIVNGLYSLDKRTISGKEISLTLDAGLCALAYNKLGNRQGAVGVYNYKTGEILCLASSPSFDPLNPPDVKGNPGKYEGVHINRFLSSAYTPGSVFKLVTAAAAIDNIDDNENKTYLCEGNLQIGKDAVTCMSSHGEVTLEQALANSCNCAFARIAIELGKGKLQEYANRAGFNSSLAIDGIKTAVGKVDLAEAKEIDLAWAGIGQIYQYGNPLNFMAFMGSNCP